MELTPISTNFSPLNEIWPHTHIRAYDEGSGFKRQVYYRGSPWGSLGTPTQTVFSFGVFLFNGGRVFADRSPSSSYTLAATRLASIPASNSCLLITPKGAESPSSGRIGVISALLHFST